MNLKVQILDFKFNQINKINHNYDSINIYNNRCCDSFISDYILNKG